MKERGRTTTNGNVKMCDFCALVKHCECHKFGAAKLDRLVWSCRPPQFAIMKIPISLLTNTQHIQSSNANGVTSNSCPNELKNLYLVRKQRTIAVFLIIRCAFGVSLLPIFVSHMNFVALNEMRSQLMASKDWSWVFYRRESIYSGTKKTNCKQKISEM